MCRTRAAEVGTERGVALPMALFALLVITVLTMAFAGLAVTEPAIGQNHLLTTRARALAESGMELALWALSNPSDPKGLPTTLQNGVAPAPYNGDQFVALSALGGFRIRVTDGLVSGERTVMASGWSPTDDPADPRPKSARKIQATLARTGVRLLDPPCALCVQGDIELRDRTRVDARTGHCSGGPTPLGGILITGSILRRDSDVRVWGPGNDIPNESADMPSGPSQDFSFKYTSDEIETLKSIARASGTYYRGSVRFDDGSPMPNGVVFVDTLSGNEFTQSSPDGDAAYVEVEGNLTWRGWLIVAGSARLRGQITLRGLVYLLDDLRFELSSGSLSGAIVAENRKSSTGSMSRIDDDASVQYHCQYVRDPGSSLPSGWILKAGSFREVDGR